MNKVKRSDWVTTQSGGKGIVTRISKDGEWADVNWGQWNKRMPVSSLIVLTTIPIGNSWTVTDVQREMEVRQ